MERGVYFDAWFPRQHCYHPSLPPRRLKMVEDLVAYRATGLVWSALGGGSVSLPYLEQEAYAPVDPRYRFYGFLNDAEFIAACRERGIKVFGIVFEVQGWEFPVELDPEERTILALNEPRGVGKRDRLGIRQFTQDRYPHLWPSVRRYFPDGLRGEDGELVNDLLEEACSRDIHGQALHARWVECPDRDHACYLMDRNNPAWREYLKAIIRIQVDAGVHGVQLDEAETPITALQYGGCFCASCMRGFREYLAALPPEELPAELAGADLANFQYGEWLLARGHDFKVDREVAPLFGEYMRFQRRQITHYFGELAEYAREYARSRGREVLVSGNFFNLFDHYYPLEPYVDVVITEMRNTTYRQPAWYRYVAGFCGPKPVVVVENPYGGVVLDLIERLKVGRGYDLFRLSLYEAAALGANMSVPYGSWMGSVIEDAFYAPHELCVEVQGFLAEHEHLYSRETLSEVAVIYSVASNQELVARRDLGADNRTNVTGDVAVSFWSVCEALSDAGQPYDVVFFPEGELRPDSLTADELRRYRSVVLPECRSLTARQAEALRGYLDAGGRLLALGELGANLPEEERRVLLEHSRCTVLAAADGFDAAVLPDGPQVRWATETDLAVCIQQTHQGAALHLIRYAFDEGADAVSPLPELAFELRLPEEYRLVAVHAPGDGAPTAELTAEGDRHRLRLRDVPLYCVLELERAGGGA